MTKPVSRLSEIPRILFASGLLGLRRFWKVSSVSKDLLVLRDDPTSLGFGSVCVGFDAVSEREEVWQLIHDCLKRDDKKTLRHVFELRGVPGRYPFLLKQVLLEYPDSRRCIKFLARQGPTPTCRDFPVTAAESLTKNRLDIFLDNGIVDPNSWVESEKDPYAGSARKRTPGLSRKKVISSPLLSELIRAGRFACAGKLLDAGARVDVCQCSYAGKVFTLAETPLQVLVEHLASLMSEEEEEGGGGGDEDRKEREESRREGLTLLRRLAVASRESGSLHWRVRHHERPVVETAVGLACLLKDAETVRTLLEVQEGARRGEQQLPFLAITPIPEPKEDPHDWASSDSDVSARPESLGLDRRCVGVLEVLADGGVDLGGVGGKGKGKQRSLLIEAIKGGSVPLVSLLLSRGADPNRVGKGWEGIWPGEKGLLVSPLQANFHTSRTWFREERHRRVALTKLLIAHGARCPLSLRTVSQSNQEQRESQKGERLVSSAKASGISDASPLLAASKCPDAELVRLLCEGAGADPNAAVQRGGKTLVCPLAEMIRAADSPSIDRPRSSEAFFRQMTAQWVDVVNALIDVGANVEGITERGEWGTYMDGPDEAMAFLARHWGGYPNVLEGPQSGHTPLSLCCRRGLKDIAAALLRRGARVGGVERAGRPLRVPLVEAVASNLSVETADLIRLLLDAGADENQEGWVPFRLPKTPVRDYDSSDDDSDSDSDSSSSSSSSDQSRGVSASSLPSPQKNWQWVRISPLQASADKWVDFYATQRAIVFNNGVSAKDRQEGKREAARACVKLLVERGARCSLPPSSQGSETMKQAPAETAAAVKSTVSPLLCACLMKDVDLVRLMCKEGQADPNKGDGEVKCPLAFVLSDRLIWGPGKDSLERVREALLTQWNLAVALVEGGARVDLLSNSANWLKRPSKIQTEAVEAEGWNQASMLGSGSWLADLICLEEARGPLLLEIIERTPLKMLEEPLVDRGKLLWGCDRDMSPLVAAIHEGWEEGALALIEQGVGVHRENEPPKKKGGKWLVGESVSGRSSITRCRFDSPIYAALEKRQWDVVRALCRRFAHFMAWERYFGLDRYGPSLPEDLRHILSDRFSNYRVEKQERVEDSKISVCKRRRRLDSDSDSSASSSDSSSSDSSMDSGDEDEDDEED